MVGTVYVQEELFPAVTQVLLQEDSDISFVAAAAKQPIAHDGFEHADVKPTQQ